MLYYVPLESYKTRYTSQWSAPRVGWLERKWIENKVEYERIEGSIGHETAFAPHSQEMGKGKVLNLKRRLGWAFKQTETLVTMILDGKITNNDRILFDDFWHPGIEQIAMAMEQVRDWIRMGAFCHAQSVDQYDFTTRMQPWIRHAEAAAMDIYSHVFVNSPILAELLDVAFPQSHAEKHCVGHVFDSESVISSIPHRDNKKKNQVVFSSRFDSEKQPHLFLDVVEWYINNRHGCRYDDVNFIICSGTEFRSDDQTAIDRAKDLEQRFPEFLEIRDELDKSQYYTILQESAVQLSTSLQDWISFCLLESVSFGCVPVYPNYRSFPDAFGEFNTLLYPAGLQVNPKRQIEIINEYIQDALQIADSNDMIFKAKLFNTIVERHDSTWHRMMNCLSVHVPGPSEGKQE